MVDLRKVTDIELLRQVALLQDQELRRRMETISRLKARLAKLQGDERSQLELEIVFLKEQLRERERLLFGQSSEKLKPDETEGDGQPVKKDQIGHGPTDQPDLPVVEQIHELDEADRICPSCGGSLDEWEGQFEQSEEIDVVELEYRLVRHRRKKYRCRCGGCVDTALGPQKLIPGGRYSVDFGVHVAVGKYADHLPLARQVKQMSRSGLQVSSQTLWDQLEALAGHLQPTYEALKGYVRSSPVIGADETTWPLMKKGETKKWYVWSLSRPDAVYHEIHPSRSQTAARSILGGYQGVVVTDGYQTYQTIQKHSPGRSRDGPGFELAFCWAHVRRKFFSCRQDYPDAEDVLKLIGGLYEVEAEARGSPDQDRLSVLSRLREDRSVSLIAEIHAWLVDQKSKSLPKSSFGKAIDYALKLWPGLVRFLKDPRIPLDNNATERALRSPVLGRKNHYGSRSRRGTEVSALFYSLIETAKLSGLEPSLYLSWATRRAIQAPGTVTLPSEIIDQAAQEGQAQAEILTEAIEG